MQTTPAKVHTHCATDLRQDADRHAGPRVRLRWRLELNARDLQGDSSALHEAIRRGTTGMAAEADVVVKVRGQIGATAGGGAQVGMALWDARTIEVLAGGPGAACFAEELQRGAVAVREERLWAS